MRLTQLCLISSICFSAAVARAEPVLTGSLYEYIQPTNPFEAIALGLSANSEDRGIGVSASPTISGNEMGDALSQFSDLRGALQNLERLKTESHYRGGRVFALFTYDDHGRLDLMCGLSRSESRDPDEIRQNFTHFGQTQAALSLFSNFKYATRAERVRAIARCLQTLPGMPELRPAPHVIRSLYIDAKSYRFGSQYFRERGLIGTEEQYRAAFRCMVTRVAESEPDATGDTVVVKSAEPRRVELPTSSSSPIFGSYRTTRTVESDLPFIGMAVTNPEAGRRLAGRSVDDMGGIWPSRVGMASNAVDQLFGSARSRWLGPCRQQAGLIDSSFSRGIASASTGCHQ